jgi:hypothetical protein
MYCDDVDLMFTHRFAGELLAIEEFNQSDAGVRIDSWRGINKHRPFPEAPWAEPHVHSTRRGGHFAVSRRAKTESNQGRRTGRGDSLSASSSIQFLTLLRTEPAGTSEQRVYDTLHVDHVALAILLQRSIRAGRGSHGLCNGNLNIQVVHNSIRVEIADGRAPIAINGRDFRS